MYSNGERNFWLLGDSGYPQLPYLMTPIPGNNLSDSEHNYNRHHRKARNCVERCFGVLKSRFRCLSKDRVLMYDPVLAGKIINACIILHNIMILNNIRYEIEDDDNISFDEEFNLVDEITSTHHGIAARQQIVNNYFNY
ncbi:PREDICTED: putative nuclease HARBI1 [Rhagoletis zephyria]|uniref:putative nuclease HARBI1 n=1 Tax=Rhagoletis zephyria TaxID=28612 RepID=UPI0008117FE3|nr:PREDICTED: putative nuclease HARBI1 [Rhagoletis zephyria]